MGELQLSEQDVDLLITALKVLLQRVEDGEMDVTALQTSVRSMLECLKQLHNEERAQTIIAIQKTLSEIATELESNSLGIDALDQS